MTYVQGLVAAVPSANRQAYLEHARLAAQLFKEFGTTRSVEAWGDDVPRGKLNDFHGAVKAGEDETVVFSWMEYPDKATRDAMFEKMMSDPRMQALPEMPFDGKRMILGGFDPFVDVGNGRGGYFDGYLLPVSAGDREAYRDHAQKCAGIFLEYGALRVLEAWGDDVPVGKVTDFKRAVLAADGESIVFSWIEWPSRQVRDAAWPKLMKDERMMPDGGMPFDGKRMVYGGFEPLLDD